MDIDNYSSKFFSGVENKVYKLSSEKIEKYNYHQNYVLKIGEREIEFVPYDDNLNFGLIGDIINNVNKKTHFLYIDEPTNINSINDFHIDPNEISNIKKIQTFILQNLGIGVSSIIDNIHGYNGLYNYMQVRAENNEIFNYYNYLFKNEDKKSTLEIFKLYKMAYLYPVKHLLILYNLLLDVPSLFEINPNDYTKYDHLIPDVINSLFNSYDLREKYESSQTSAFSKLFSNILPNDYDKTPFDLLQMDIYQTADFNLGIIENIIRDFRNDFRTFLTLITLKEILKENNYQKAYVLVHSKVFTAYVNPMLASTMHNHILDIKKLKKTIPIRKLEVMDDVNKYKNEEYLRRVQEVGSIAEEKIDDEEIAAAADSLILDVSDVDMEGTEGKIEIQKLPSKKIGSRLKRKRKRTEAAEDDTYDKDTVNAILSKLKKRKK